MTDPGPGMPRFVIVGYVDDKIFGIYDSKSRTAQPIAEMLPQEDQEHWAVQTQKAQGGERDFDWFLSRLPERYNKSKGSHTMQMMIGCDILEDGSIRGYDQYAFDGRDFLAFDMDTMTFTAADPVAEITKRRWETEGTYAERWKHELGTVCVQNLRRYLEHGKVALKRRVQPVVRVWGKEADRILTLSCRAYGFYPRPIAISWMKDGMVRDQETHWGGMVPNSDGTYHASATIDVLPEDGDKYRCRVEHASLPQPGLFSWGQSAPSWLSLLLSLESWCGRASQGRRRRVMKQRQATIENPASRPQVQCETGTQEGSLRLVRSQFPALPRWAHSRGNTGPSPPWRTPTVVSRDGDVVPYDTTSSHLHRK
ncbi:class I histocompatibility antigen, F10 alpha chain-like isoform X9 [Gallus gallus]|nr:class I histocompatibility antigen, F10 alpha chain-like isoform X9 [Gallus gallus]XP_046757485.1 class I histocompatibility antigen, F10 alpha chain-like isoform X9 [Gallus gallus]